ncbi:transcriptional repressor TCF25-domain-containing protein [Gigaspora rosea]|uniref:Transcriptional repressor TCF25-domain-containing protein n=1 Tax=Gigaspora rosea TaxID=44941 RepID=A0A397U1T3_9GLOM|nr:transcriptional repressor TCF25-domain-containing protein [Gigaspora rosea]
MSSRAFKRAANKEDSLSLKHVNDDYEETIDDSDQERPKKNLFDLLNEGNDDDNVDQNSENEKISEKPSSKDSSSTVSVLSSSSKKKKKKKQKSVSTKIMTKDSDKKTKLGKKVEEMNDLELESLIREVSEKFSDSSLKITDESAVKNSSSSSAAPSNISFLLVDTRLLDDDGEMRRMFSSGVVDREIRNRNYARTVKKTALAKPRQNWPPITKSGLGMELLEEKDGIFYFTFTHSQQYQTIQISFIQCVATHDPNTIYALLRDNPYHIDSLLQMSDIYKMSGDLVMAQEFLERALYAFERNFHLKFNITRGTSRMSYKCYENRAFFLALFRHIQSLSRRGCWQTSFEFSKLLLSLDPINDPLCTLRFIDYIGLKARQYSYVLSMANEWNYHDLQNWPNFAYSSALAKFQLELQNDSKNPIHDVSTAMLERAILCFPSMVLLLAEKCDIQLDSDVAEDQFLQDTPTSDYLDLLIDLYVDQASPLWAQPEVISWLQTASINVFLKQQIPSYKACLTDVEFNEALEHGKNIRKNLFNGPVSLDLSRYIVVSENSKFISSLPEIANREINLYDPLPPPDGISPYENTSSTFTRIADFENVLADDLRTFLDRVPNGNVRMLAERIHQIADITNLQAAAERLIGLLVGPHINNDNNSDNLPTQDQELVMPGGFPRDNDNTDLNQETNQESNPELNQESNQEFNQESNQESNQGSNESENVDT